MEWTGLLIYTNPYNRPNELHGPVAARAAALLTMTEECTFTRAEVCLTTV